MARKKGGMAIKKKKESKRNLQFFWGVFIAISLVFGMLVIMDDSQPATVQDFEYNNFSFYYEYDRSVGFNFVKTSIGGVEFSFFSEPYRAEPFDVGYELLEKMVYSEKTYLSLDAESQMSDIIGLASFSLQTDFLAIGKPFEMAVLKESEMTSYPVITCKNASEDVFVVTMEEGEETEFISEENCLRIVSEYPFGFLEMRDVILYKMLGIIE